MGTFYSPHGIDLAVNATIERFESSTVRLRPKHWQIILRSRDDYTRKFK